MDDCRIFFKQITVGEADGGMFNADLASVHDTRVVNPFLPIVRS